jgi:hypothetical protein
MIRGETNLCSNVLLRKLLPHEQIVLQCNEKESTIFIRLTVASIVVEPECSLPSLRNTKLVCLITVYILTIVRTV